MPTITRRRSSIDEVDRQLIAALVANGRMTFQELGRLVHLSANSVADRVRRLRESGLVRGFRAELDLERIGRTLLALSDTKLHADVDRLAFEQELASIPQVLAATHTTGEYDYQIRVACTDTPDLERVVDRLRAIGVREIHSRIVLSEVHLDVTRLLGA